MKPNQKGYGFFYSLFAMGTLLLSSCSVMGQGHQKRDLREADYEKWGTLRTGELSDDGNWTSFEMIYSNQNDTLFLKRTDADKTYFFPKGKKGSFGAESIFACLEPDETLRIVELSSGKMHLCPNVAEYELLMQGKYILTADRLIREVKVLRIRNQKGIVIDSITDVTDYLSNPMKNALVFTTRKGKHNAIGIINFQDYSQRIIAQTNNKEFQQLTWQENGKSLAYRQQAEGTVKTTVMQLYRIAEKHLFTFDTQNADFKEHFAIYDGFDVSIGDNGSQVFFWVISKQQPEVKESSSTVEIWNGTDMQLYPSRPKNAAFADIPKLACWYPEKNQFRLVSTDELPQKRLNPKQDYALLSNKYRYGLENQYYENVDFYLKNIWTGKQKLLLEHQSHDPNQIGFSAFGNKIVYYRDQNWWVYDSDEDSHRNITKGILTKWDNSGSNIPHQFGVHGNPGWSADGKYVLLYDAFDIWCVALDGSKYERLTKGREEQIRYVIAPVEYDGFKLGNYEGRNSFVYDLSKDLLLEARRLTDYASGYYLLNAKKNKSKKLVFESAKLKNIKKVKGEKKGFLYTAERFDQSPKLLFLQNENALPKLLFESNRQQHGYYYGRSELLTYANSKGEPLKGALFYPAHYDANKKYPMVVNIYDALSKQLNGYVNPSLLNAEGFNSCNFTLNGYFVWLPDITYQLGNPGISASDCITAGVNAVIERGCIDKERIGLMGHSFGGYETDFIITHSTLFAAAVSGSGISDPIAFYFNLGQNGTINSDMWRFESQQWRMGKSLFEDREGYLRNSPILHADKIKTPLLLWSGKNDRIVPIHQSEAFYLALRRLGVKNLLLAYPGEGHSIENPINQADLTHRIQQWFDYFLKDKISESWISKGTGFD